MPAGRLGSKGRTCCRSGRWTEAGRPKNRLRLQAFRAAPPVITRFASMSPPSRPLVLWHASSRPPEQPRRDAELFFAGADRTADGLQAADGWQSPYVSTYNTDFAFDYGLVLTEVGLAVSEGARPLKFDTYPCRLQSTAGKELQNRGPRVRILPPLPSFSSSCHRLS